MAQLLLSRCFPEQLKDIFPNGSHLLAALHDIGKVSPTFLEKILRATTGYLANSHPSTTHADPELEKQWGGHAGVSQAELIKTMPYSLSGMVAGQHHGYLPDLQGRLEISEAFGSLSWHQQRVELVRALQEAFGCVVPDIQDPTVARLVSGLTTVADWIGSAGEFNNPEFQWRGQIEKALDDAGFSVLDPLRGLSFSDVFGFDPNPIQKDFVDQVTGPGVYVLEAQMGKGKTEAALYAAYKVMQLGLARGVYFALPTKLTSEKIYDRLATFASKILNPDTNPIRPKLLHGSSWFMQELDLGEDAAPGGSWFNQGKRGILAPFAAGTVDQALMAVMNVKHGFLRTFGLAGKVVIIDEVHSYDTYTGTILSNLIQVLVQLKCTVIVLSATLNLAQKRELMGPQCADIRYPLITSKPASGVLSELAPDVGAERQIEVDIRQVHNDDLAEQEAIKRALEGQQVLWIENTVAQAQERYLSLRHQVEDTEVECGLIHSRFVPYHRQINESRWVSLYGKGGGVDRALTGRILVGTQVLEQSIDIDSDFLVSRFCPTDMLFQRLGRLWRHQTTQRPAHATCEAWILTPSESLLDQGIKKSFGKSSFVYDPYVLYRSLQVWKSRNSVQLPADIRSLIDQTYVEQEPENKEVSALFHELENGVRYGPGKRPGRNQLKQFAQNTLTLIGARADDENPPTRYSEQELVNVLLLKELRIKPEIGSSELTAVNGQSVQIPLVRARISRKQSRQIAMFLAQNTVSVSPWSAPSAATIGELRSYGLHNVMFVGSVEQGLHEEAAVRVGLVDRAGRVTGLNYTESQYFYTPDLGYWKQGD